MGSGLHGGFGKTFGAAAGDAVFQSDPGQFFANVGKRTDKDRNGIFDIVAHGGSAIIQVTHGGKTVEVNARTVAKMLQARTDYRRGQPIRLLSCNTGSSTAGFAQNLANKLNVVVEAPTKLVWAYPNGRIIVAGRLASNPQLPDLNDRGYFRKFFPGGKKK